MWKDEEAFRYLELTGSTKVLEKPEDSGQPSTVLTSPPNIISQGAVAEKGTTAAYRHNTMFGTGLTSAATQEQYFQM